MALDDFFQNPLAMSGINAYLSLLGTPRQAGWGQGLARAGQAGLNTYLTMPYVQAQAEQAKAKAEQLKAQNAAVAGITDPQKRLDWTLAPKEAAKGDLIRGAAIEANNKVADFFDVTAQKDPRYAGYGAIFRDNPMKMDPRTVMTMLQYPDSQEALKFKNKLLQAQEKNVADLPGSRERALRQQAADAAAGRGVTMRGQDLTAGTAAAGQALTERGLDLRERGQGMAADTAAAGRALTARGQDLAAENAAASRAVTERGQGMAADRAAAGRSLTERGLGLKERAQGWKETHPTAGKGDDPLITLTTMKDDLEELKTLYQTPEGKAAVGGIAGRWADVQKQFGSEGGMVPEASENALKLMGVTSRIQSKLGKLVSGLVLSDNEVIRLKAQLPDYQTSHKAFEVGMKNFEMELDNIIKARQAQGLRVPGETPRQQPAPPGETAGRSYRVTPPVGMGEPKVYDTKEFYDDAVKSNPAMKKWRTEIEVPAGGDASVYSDEEIDAEIERRRRLRGQ